jgi:ATP sulfurylase
VALSGTEVRRRLGTGEEIPPEFSRPEGAAVLHKALAEREAAAAAQRPGS